MFNILYISIYKYIDTNIHVYIHTYLHNLSINLLLYSQPLTKTLKTNSCQYYFGIVYKSHNLYFQFPSLHMYYCINVPIFWSAIILTFKIYFRLSFLDWRFYSSCCLCILFCLISCLPLFCGLIPYCMWLA